MRFWNRFENAISQVSWQIRVTYKGCKSGGKMDTNTEEALMK